ncbi:extracellular solute-binding protein family 5 [Chloroherpeton thalassium ATCC 35110]|uniref:Extracellular solute-binding protein family 5 n=1 Tax=Chloroherpeton thalassium (strain ATCC 35110 / GB-78) TaxID=517418 RepID=B3QYA7_CHLT3|nr:ABC transporter substrate-binding protein [Chloroherpeton thalassium]ACF15073.1 extracellular solute-binding protein family 5 [Chloroherpeton thalassium ATCC 35110]
MRKLLSVVFLIGCFVGCGSRDDGQEPPLYKQAAGGKVYGGKFVYNETSDLPTLDPVQIGDVASHHVANQVYELLVDLDQKTLEIVPELAKSWEISEDGLTYTFHLRDSIYFHSSPCFPQATQKKMTASDVKYSFERVCDPNTQTKGFSIFKDRVVGATKYFEDLLSAKKDARDEVLDEVDGFVARNDTTFIIKLEKPFAPFLKTLTSAFCYVVPREAVIYYGTNFRMHPIGTGPFMFSEFKEGQYLKLERNPTYWQHDEAGNQLPFLDEIKVSFIRDLSTQLMEFSQGQLSECYRIPEELRPNWVSENGTLTDQYKNDFALQSVPALSVQYYGFNTKLEPFQKKLVRQAFSYAIDREKIAKYVLKGGVASPAHFGIVPPSMPKYDASKTKGYEFNPEKARKLLAEAGYPNGNSFPKVTLQLNSGGGRNEQVAEAVQAMLKENLNIEVALSIVEWSQHLESQERSKAPFFRAGWVADYPEPENFLNLFYGKLVPKKLDARSYPNTTRLESAVFDSLYEKALSTVNDSVRYALYQKAEQAAVAEAPMIFIFYDLDERLLNKDVRDYPINPMDRRDYKTVWFDRLETKTAAAKPETK